jgi:hypothetical protein
MKKKWPQRLRIKGGLGTVLDVDDGILIPWLKTDRETDTQSSRNGDWKFGRKAYI